MRQNTEYSNTFCRDYPGEISSESDAGINAGFRIRLDGLIEHTFSDYYPQNMTEGTSRTSNEIMVKEPFSKETKKLELFEVDGQPLTLHFYIYKPEEHPENHLPYSPSINAIFHLQATEAKPARIYESIYLSQKHFDTSNSRYDELKILENFERMEQAIDLYNWALGVNQPAIS